MKTLVVTLLAIAGLHQSQETKLPKAKRGSAVGDYALLGDLNSAQAGWKVNTADFNLNVDLPGLRRIPQAAVASPYRSVSRQPLRIVGNSIDKPIIEAQEYIPPQSTGTAILPQMPPPAVPVNAVASNIPASGGAVFLGSGSIGVVDLGNGAYALGSGALGYSENRARPRPTTTVPVYPPIKASPDLIPAAVPTPQPPQFGFIDYTHPYLGVPQLPQIDQNGYEYLPPNRVGFGEPNPPRPIRTRQQFATPTALQLQPQVPQIGNDLNFGVHLGHPSLSHVPILA